MVGATAVVVPFHGGAGMQSKIFEPLSLGAVVIANPKSLVRYPYIASKHYVPAKTLDEFISAILTLSLDSDKAKSIAVSAREKSQELFNELVLLNLIEDAILD